MSAQDAKWMQAALSEGRLALEHADVPVGAVVVDEGGVELARAHNRREADADPTAHAEILALRQAAARLGRWRLSGATLYVTLEPCAMCAGAVVASRIAKVVYAARDPKAGAMESLFTLGSDPRLNHRVEVVAGVAEAEAQAELAAFFKALRSGG